ncbi:MAG TPA: ketoacyl-ACP synthase III [Bacteroidales bacterium]|nr:ketoacyl-ACP synthase III [Bacteroidales bacterium]
MFPSVYYSVIKGTGSYLPCNPVPNDDFLQSQFYDARGNKIETPAKEIIEKFRAITGIDERRYISSEKVTSDIACLAAEQAILSSGTDPESLDYIIVAHNFGDVRFGDNRTDMVPSLAARVKYKLGIKNPMTVAFDLPFGCPGWLQAMITADYFIKSGNVKKILVVGAETLSRISDPHDRDSMIYADGAGATLLEATQNSEPVGIISHSARSDTVNHFRLMWMGKSNNPLYGNGDYFIKMNGHRLYEYAISYVPQLVKETIEKAGIEPVQVKKILIHQANEKLDQEIINRLYKLYGYERPPEDIMPMTISYLGNNSVATIPILIDLLWKKKLNSHTLSAGDYVVFASVGAGMNINAIVYRMV